MDIERAISRRKLGQAGIAAMALVGMGGQRMVNRTVASDEASDFGNVAQAINDAVQDGIMAAAVMSVRHGDHCQSWAFGEACSVDSVFLLASITKPMVAAVVMTLCDAGELRLDDPVDRFLPQFCGEDRNRVSIRHLLSHTAGLPDQLPQNRQLRSQHAELDQFVEGAMQVPLAFSPGSKFLYSSMGILLASEIAGRISGVPMKRLIDERIFGPLEMRGASLGTGGRPIAQLMRCQTEHAAAEAGAGDADSKSWDWNSEYWRNLGAPWGGAHGSAEDVSKFLADFLWPSGKVLRSATAAEMVTRQFAPSVSSRGLGFGIGRSNSSRFCSASAFGHTGSTGTLAWADPSTQTVCVVLTTMPSGVVDPHPRQVASDAFAKSIRQSKSRLPGR